MRISALTIFAALAVTSAFGQTGLQKDTFSWTYFRPTNTGIQGDFNEALWIAPDGNPWIGGYDAGFEEGGIAKFFVSQNRWYNISNVDYPVIGHPDNVGTSRISDIDVDANGRMWMATGRGGLFYDPAIGPKSLRRFGDDNSPIPGGWNRGVEVATDGSVWFSSYSTVWGGGGIAKYVPTTNQWQVWTTGVGGGPLAVQPKPTSGYYVWTMMGQDSARFDSGTGQWTILPKANGNPAYLIGNNLTDAAGNTWMYKWTNATLSEAVLDLRRPNGTWANVPHAPFDVQFNAAKCVRAKGANQAVFVDGGGTAYRFNGSVWIDLGMWFNNVDTYDVDMDELGNVWVCGIGGAGRRDVTTGQWQRYRLTNTSQYDFFNNDLTLGKGGVVYACANAGPGYGGMVKFNGASWTGFNNFHYGIGVDWPFNSDNSQRVYVRPSNGNVVVNPTFGFLHSYNGSTWTNLNSILDSPSGIFEDATGRLWMGSAGYLGYYNGSGFTRVENGTLNVGGNMIKQDPQNPGTIWALDAFSITRTNGVTSQTWTLDHFPEIDQQSDQFKGFAVQPNGTVWIAANTINLPNNSHVFKMHPSTGAYTTYSYATGWPFPGEYVMPLAATNDGKVWMQYDSDYLTAIQGLCAFDGQNLKAFPAPAYGAMQWGGLPHAGIADIEVRPLKDGYELWMSCMSRGIAVLKVQRRTLGK